MESETKTHIANKGTWIRLVYMILFAVIFNVAELVLGAVVVAQFLFKLLTGQANERLQSFGHRLATYFRQIIEFLTFHTEDKPYPFGEWPAAAEQPAAIAAKAASAGKSTARKRQKPAPKAAPEAEEPPDEKSADEDPADEAPKA